MPDDRWILRTIWAPTRRAPTARTSLIRHRSNSANPFYWTGALGDVPLDLLELLLKDLSWRPFSKIDISMSRFLIRKRPFVFEIKFLSFNHLFKLWRMFIVLAWILFTDSENRVIRGIPLPHDLEHFLKLGKRFLVTVRQT
jgi:hypothetical protein